jgi:hypothetical protein
MKQKYESITFRPASLRLIETINTIIADYVAQGYRLTLRQLYYQLVARDILPNTEKSYKNTGRLVNDGRMAGLIDWDAIEDRTRSFISRGHWTDASSILYSAANSYHQDMWANQDYRVFVIVEKEALAGVLERVCHDWDVPLLAARGYPSASVLREFVQRDMRYEDKQIVLLHLGDHDPSGIDMTRDLNERIALFNNYEPFDLYRIALTMEQIEEQKPPPNPAKVIDPRFTEYERMYGDKSWELDALSPSYLANLVAENIQRFVEPNNWAETKAEINSVKERIKTVANDFTN